jgi:hypothetical protein
MKGLAPWAGDDSWDTRNRNSQPVADATSITLIN